MTKAQNFKFLSLYDSFIVNVNQVDEEGETIRKTLNPLKFRGEVEVQPNYSIEDQKDAEFELQESNQGALFRCPNEGKYYQIFV